MPSWPSSARRVRHADFLDHGAGRRHRRGRSRPAGGAGRGGGRDPRPATPHSRAARLEAPVGAANAIASPSISASRRWPGRWAKPTWRRSTGSTSCRRPCSRCGARSKGSRSLPAWHGSTAIVVRSSGAPCWRSSTAIATSPSFRRRRSSPRPRATRCWSSSTADIRRTALPTTVATARPSISRRSRATDRVPRIAGASRRSRRRLRLLASLRRGAAVRVGHSGGRSLRTVSSEGR